MIMSCNIDSDGFPDDTFKNPQDFENALLDTYKTFLSGDYYGGARSGDLNSIPEVLADNLIRNSNGSGTKRTLYNYNFDASNAHMGIYSKAYHIIYRTNLILHHLELSNLNEKYRSQIAAEARAIRAIAHFDVVKLYAKIPTQGGELGTSIPYITHPDQQSSQTKESVSETYHKIIEDLEFAYNNIDTTIIENKLNKEAIAIYLSRVYLYLGGNESNSKASKYASTVTTLPTRRDELASVFTDNTKAGVIFFISNNLGDEEINMPIGATWGIGNINNRTSEYNVTPSFYNMFEPNDIRKTAFMKVGKDRNGDEGIFPAKLWGKDGSDNGIVDLKILRVEEAILNKAEAEYNLGNYDIALTELDKLREIRYENFTSGNETGEALWEAIKLERRLEFAFEYNRFLDIKRWGENLNRFNEGYQRDGSGQKPIILELENSNFRFVLPYSQDALFRDPSLVQNPGY